MLDMATAPSDEDLDTARGVLRWLVDDLLENEPAATTTIATLKLAAGYIPTTVDELKELRL